MDNAVALVQAYLQVNGYFTVTEYPVLEAARHGIETATDIDVLALRFPNAGRLVPGKKGTKERWIAEVDEALGCPSSRVDMLIGEVKEGRAELNRAARNPDVLRAVLVRFGCCSEEHVDASVHRLLHQGVADMPNGHRVRLVAFGAQLPEAPTGCHLIALGHVVEYLEHYLHAHWDVMRHAQFKHPAFGFLATLEKARRGHRQTAGSHE